MTNILQLRRGTTAQSDAFTGSIAEVTVDTDRNSLRVHDSVTQGGTELASLKTAIPLLPSAASVAGIDTFPVIQSGVARKATKTQILDGIANANISAGAAIALNKLATGALPTGITVASANLVDGTIVDADINASAEIAVSKLADGAARQLLQTDAAGTGVEWTDNVDVPGTLDVTGAATLDSTLTVVGATTLNGGLTMGDADDIVLGTATGTKIGTATTQKIGFYNVAPVVQPAAAAQAAAAAQTQDSVTDNTGGTTGTTLAAITAPAANATTSLTDDMTAVKNAIASIAAQLAKIKTDVANIKTLQDAERTALVNLGLMKGAA